VAVSSRHGQKSGRSKVDRKGSDKSHESSKESDKSRKSSKGSDKPGGSSEGSRSDIYGRGMMALTEAGGGACADGVAQSPVPAVQLLLLRALASQLVILPLVVRMVAAAAVPSVEDPEVVVPTVALTEALAREAVVEMVNWCLIKVPEAPLLVTAERMPVAMAQERVTRIGCVPA
jgi:hypothetical protein